MTRKRHSRFTGLDDALRTLTILPWPGKGAGDLASSLPWFPVVGLLLGSILYGVAIASSLVPVPFWPEGTAAILLILEIVLTRGLHLDGLADWADSMGAFSDREKRLAIMKDHSIGAFGMLALFADLLVKWVALDRLLSSGAIIWLIPVFVLSRGFMVELMTTLPSARSGKGMAGPFIREKSELQRFAALLLGLLFVLPFGPIGLVFFMVAWLLIGLFRIRCRDQFGGITGDLLGTANEMVMLALLAIIAFSGPRIMACTGWWWMFT